MKKEIKAFQVIFAVSESDDQSSDVSVISVRVISADGADPTSSTFIKDEEVYTVKSSEPNQAIALLIPALNDAISKINKEKAVDTHSQVEKVTRVSEVRFKIPEFK